MSGEMGRSAAGGTVRPMGQGGAPQFSDGADGQFSGGPVNGHIPEPSRAGRTTAPAVPARSSDLADGPPVVAQLVVSTARSAVERGTQKHPQSSGRNRLGPGTVDTVETMRDSDTSTDYRGPEIPAPLGDQLRAALALEERPGTFGDWVDAMAVLVDREGIDVDLDTLCTTDESPHRATFDGRTQHYQCAQDAFVVPFLAEDVDAVRIETECPVTGESIAIAVNGSGLTVSPDETVVSFGVADDLDAPEAGTASPVLAYEHICPYGHAFASSEAYEAWAADVDALTMRVSTADTLQLAKALGRRA